MKISVNKIRQLMGAKLMTQDMLAKASGVSRATVNSTLLKGSCSTVTVGKIAKALVVEPIEIIDAEE